MYEKLYYKAEVGYGFHYLKYTPKNAEMRFQRRTRKNF